MVDLRWAAPFAEIRRLRGVTCAAETLDRGSRGRIRSGATARRHVGTAEGAHRAETDVRAGCRGRLTRVPFSGKT